MRGEGTDRNPPPGSGVAVPSRQRVCGWWPILSISQLLLAVLLSSAYLEGVRAVPARTILKKRLDVQWPVKPDLSSPFDTAKNGTTAQPAGGNAAAPRVVPPAVIVQPLPRVNQQYPSAQPHSHGPDTHQHAAGSNPHHGPGPGDPRQQYPGAAGHRYPINQNAHYTGNQQHSHQHQSYPAYGGPSNGQFSHPPPNPGAGMSAPADMPANSNSAQNPFMADHYGGNAPGGGYAAHGGGQRGGGYAAPGGGYYNPNSRHSAAPYDPNAPNISYYVLSQVWPNGHCMTAGRSPCQDLNYEADLWTIRGFWPAVARSGRHISFCRGTALQPLYRRNYPSQGMAINMIDSPTLVELARVWPNLDFSPNAEQKWAREYRRHGVCSPFDTGVYFHTAIDIHQRFNLFRIFEESRIYPDDLYTYRATELHQALISSTGFRGALYCRRKQINDGLQTVWVNVLYEVRLCLDTDLMAMNCPAFDVRADLSVLSYKPIPCYNDVLYPNYHYAEPEPQPPAQHQQNNGHAINGYNPSNPIDGGGYQLPKRQPVTVSPDQVAKPQIIQVNPVIKMPMAYVLPDGRVVQTIAGNPKVVAGQEGLPGLPSAVQKALNPAPPPAQRQGAVATVVNAAGPPGTSPQTHRTIRIDHPQLPNRLVIHIPKLSGPRPYQERPAVRVQQPRAPALPGHEYHAPLGNVQYPAQRPYPSRYSGARDTGIPMAKNIQHSGTAIPYADLGPRPVGTKSATKAATKSVSARPIVQQPIEKRRGFKALRKPGVLPSAAAADPDQRDTTANTTKVTDAPVGMLPLPRASHPAAVYDGNTADRTHYRTSDHAPAGVPVHVPDPIADQTIVQFEPKDPPQQQPAVSAPPDMHIVIKQ